MSLLRLTLWSVLVLSALVASDSQARADTPRTLQDFDKHKSAGIAFFRVGAFDKAIEEFEQAFALRADVKLVYNLARAYEENGDKERAVEYFKRYLASPGDLDDKRRAEAAARMVALERSLASAIASESDFAKHKRAGVAFFKAGAFDKSIIEFEKAYAKVPEQGLLFNLARSSEEAGDKESAANYLRRFLAVPDAHEKRTEAEARLVVLERDIASAAAALSAKQENERVHRALQLRAEALDAKGRSLFATGRSTEAIALWRQAHAVAPDAQYLVAIARAERAAGNLTAAIADYESAIALSPKDPLSVAARAAVAEMRQELSLQAASYDPDAWLDRRSRWGVGAKAGQLFALIKAEPTGQDEVSSWIAGIGAEALASLAITRFVTLESGLLFTDKRYRGDVDNAAVTTVLTLEVPLRVKFTTLEPATGLVANVYGGVSYGAKVFGATAGPARAEFDFINEAKKDQLDPVTAYGIAGGIEAGFRALRGEFLLDLRAELHTSPAFSQSGNEGQYFFQRDTTIFRALLAYYYRGS